jgi:predicted ATPase
MVVQDFRIKHDFINRKREINILIDTFNRVQNSAGQIVTIIGEHGIGKTKLAEELKRIITEDHSENVKFLYGRCRRTSGRDPYQPFSEALNYELPTTTPSSNKDSNIQSSSILDSASGTENQNFKEKDKLNNGRSLNSEDSSDQTISAAPLGLIPFGDTEESEELPIDEELDITPDSPVKPLPMGLIPAAFRTTEVDDIKKRRNYVYDIITKKLFDLALNSPVVLYIDDFHWINTASIKYLEYLTERINTKPIMLVFLLSLDELDESSERNTQIKELLRAFENLENFTSMTLQRFTNEDVGAIVKNIFSREDVPESFIEEIFNKTEGNPLFVEDIIRALIEEDVIDTSSLVWQTRIDISQVRIPESTRETLINKLKKLDKNALKALSYASVIGREFKFDLLAKLSEIPKEELLDFIDIILDSKLIKEDLSSNEDLYRFDNPLILDIAYSQLSRSRRRFLHTKLGSILEDENLNDVGKVVFELATHYSKGWEYDKSLKYLMLAGDNAIQIYAIDDARKYYLSALETLNKFDYTIEIQQREIDLLSNLGYTCQMLGDWDQAVEYYSNIPKLMDNLFNKIKEQQQTEELENGSSDIEPIPTNWIPLKLADTYWNLAELMRFKSQWDKSEQNYKRSLLLSQKIDDYHGIAQAERGRGYINWHQGKYRKALDHYDICIDFATKINDLPVIAVTYIDIGNIYNHLGELEQAIAYYTESIEHLSKIGWLHEMGRAYNGLGDIFVKQERWELAIENFERAEEISTRIGDSYKRGYALFKVAECYAKTNDLNRAMTNCKLAEEILSRLDDRAGLANVFRIYGIIYHYQKDWSNAEKYFKESIHLLKDLKVPYETGYAYMEYGLMLKSKGKIPQAKNCLEYSTGVFKSMDAKREVRQIEKILKTLNSTSKPKPKSAGKTKVNVSVKAPKADNQKVPL